MGKFTFEVSDDTFQQDVLNSDVPVLVDFWADWCGPCKMIAPVIDKVATKFDGKMRVGKLDVDMNPNVPESYGIQGIPTLILFKGGEAVAQIVGFRTEDQLTTALSRYVETENA